MIFFQYLAIVSYLTSIAQPDALTSNGHGDVGSSGGGSGGAIASHSDMHHRKYDSFPQLKRDLIGFVISNDNLLRERVSTVLASHNYAFTGNPLLSACIDFNRLILDFSVLLKQNIDFWNSRALHHFMINQKAGKYVECHWV